MESMTGFGRATKEIGQKQITVEIRSVNHRYLELQTRLPDSLTPLDPKIRSLVRDSVTRGKTDLTIQIHKSKDANPNLTWDRGTAGFYYQAAKEIAEEYQIPFDLTATELLHLPDVIKYSCEEEDLDELFLEVKPVVEEALLNFHTSRLSEGERLKADLLQKADELSTYVDQIERKAPLLIEAYRTKLYTKVMDVIHNEKIEIDDNRIASEVTIYADKICIDEELVRLRSHVVELHKDLLKKEPVGRKLDFLIQEMNRESNTILSKSLDKDTADLGIHMKTLVEKIREQVQNIE